MLDHMTLTVSDLGRSREFYAQALAPLGSAVQMEFEGMCGIGEPGTPSFWLRQGDGSVSAIHVAFTAKQRADVDAFHQAALAAGARDNGPPGVREDYHANYYAAFVFDPDGHNIEAVCHAAPKARRSRGAARAQGRTAPRKAAAKSGRGSTRSARKPSSRTRKASRRR